MKCVYCIRNKTNNKIYIGSTVNFKKRVRDHKSALKRGKHKNKELQKDYDKYGIDNFEFVVLLEVFDEENLRDYENWYLENYKENSYNVDENNTISLISFKLDEEAKEKIRKSKLGEKNPQAKLKLEQVITIKKMLKQEIPLNIIAKKLGVNRKLIYPIKTNRTWKHVAV